MPGATAAAPRASRAPGAGRAAAMLAVGGVTALDVRAARRLAQPQSVH
jgi:hypothetical protein